MGDRKVGYSRHTRYWQQYVFQHPPDGYQYARALEPPVELARNQWQRHTKLFVPLRGIELYHVYNSIVVNRKPWVVEVEAHIPRYGNVDKDGCIYRYGIDRLRSPSCNKIIFVSERMRELHAHKLIARGVDPEKITVVYRAVERYAPLPKSGGGPTILFVGNAFYRKGGVELLRAFERLGRRDVRLKIVSSMQVDWEVYPSKEEVAFAHATIERDPRIELLSGLSHDAVVEEMRKADMYVSTTFADPFNNTVLEAMGCKLPIITSNVRSLPEMMQHEVNGYVVDVKAKSRDVVVEEIASRLETLIDNEALRGEMGSASWDIVREKFDIAVRNRCLSRIYGDALATA